MEKYRILSVDYADLGKCAETIRIAFCEGAKEYGFTKENYPSSGAFIQVDDLIKAKNRGVHMYAAWINDKIVGFVQLEKKSDDIYSFQKFSVLPAYRQFGIGKALINFCKTNARAYGAKMLTLIMVDKNIHLKELYELAGFKFICHKTDDAHPFLQAVMEMEL